MTDIGTNAPTAPGQRLGPPTTGQRVGFVLAVLLGLSDVASVAAPTPDGEVGPPFVVLVVGALFGLATLVGVGLAWARRSRVAVRVAAGSRVLSLLLGLPVFFVDGLPPAVRVVSAVAAVLTIVAVVLMLSGPRAGAQR
ncbi:hypothetical protein [Kineosporia sp. R_H_3]|uniref:hypothetical protein n=1 Tax=Kineosporia sp. R_H_3 TaxID=1961848 RepID=UPI000B4ADA76|nr:hypothetical protein [Kineosporia sp. R_H_3]